MGRLGETEAIPGKPLKLTIDIDLQIAAEQALDDADRPLLDQLVHPGNAVADFHNSNDWMKARIVP